MKSAFPSPQFRTLFYFYWQIMYKNLYCNAAPSKMGGQRKGGGGKCWGA